jgi:hypothetical protein
MAAAAAVPVDNFVAIATKNETKTELLSQTLIKTYEWIRIVLMVVNGPMRSVELTTINQAISNKKAEIKRYISLPTRRPHTKGEQTLRLSLANLEKTRAQLEFNAWATFKAQLTADQLALYPNVSHLSTAIKNELRSTLSRASHALLQMGLLVRRGQAYDEAKLKMPLVELQKDRLAFAAAIGEVKKNLVKLAWIEAAPFSLTNREKDTKTIDNATSSTSSTALLLIPSFDVVGSLDDHVHASTPQTDRHFSWPIRSARLALEVVDDLGTRVNLGSWWDIYVSDDVDDINKNDVINDAAFSTVEFEANWSAVPGKANKSKIDWLRPIPTLARLSAAIKIADDASVGVKPSTRKQRYRHRDYQDATA